MRDCISIGRRRVIGAMACCLAAVTSCGSSENQTAGGGGGGSAGAKVVDGRDVATKPGDFAGKTVTSEARFTGDTGEPIPTDAGSPLAANGGWTQWAAPGTRESVGTLGDKNFELMLLTPSVELRDKWRAVQATSKDQWSSYLVTYTVDPPKGVKMEHLMGTLVDVKLK